MGWECGVATESRRQLLRAMRIKKARETARFFHSAKGSHFNISGFGAIMLS